MPILGRTAQLIVNPSFSAGAGAPWTALANVMQVASGGSPPTYDGTSLTQQNAGAYHFVQDVAVDPADYGRIDAGTCVADCAGYGVALFAGSTGTIYLSARDAGGTELQRWSYTLVGVGFPYQQLNVAMQVVPVLTRSLRIGMQGTNAFAGVYYDNFSLYLDDLAIDLNKGVLYVAHGVPAGRVLATKINEYVVLGGGNAPKQVAIKNVLYAVMAPSTQLRMTKGVMYIVTGPPCGYNGTIVACMDRPMMNAYSECGARPASLAEGSTTRPAVAFRGDTPITRCH